MKNLYAVIISLLLLSSCSQQKYAFRKTVRVDNKSEATVKQHKALATKITEKNAKQIEPSVAINEKAHQAAANHQPILENSAIASSQEVKPIEVKPEWKEKEVVKQETKKAEKPKKSDKTMGSSNGLAIAGFIMAILGWFIAGILFCTLGVIFCALGLKSERKGLAIAGLVIGILGLIFTIVALASL